MMNQQQQNIDPARLPPVCLNPLDCNLDFLLDPGNLKARTLSKDGFGYMWSGARANLGITQGRFYFKVKVLEPQTVNVVSLKDLNTDSIARIGVSMLSTDPGHLGEVSPALSCSELQVCLFQSGPATDAALVCSHRCCTPGDMGAQGRSLAT